MNKKSLNLIATFLVFAVITISYNKDCWASDLQDVVPYLKTSSSDSFAQQMDMDYLEGCPILIKQKWHDHDSKYGAGVTQTWVIGKMWSERGISLDSGSAFKSTRIGDKADKNSKHSLKNWRLVYVGSWKRIEKLNKQIRLVSIQLNESEHKTGGMINFYESLDDKNKKIPEMSLKLIKPTYGNELCILKWHHKFGYNAIAETHRKLQPGFWNWLLRNHETIVTGKVVEATD